MGESKHWAKDYILDPLNGPDPSDETGPGAHFRSTFAPITPSPGPEAKQPQVAAHSTGGSTSTNPFRRSTGSRDANYPTPPASASPRKEKFPAYDQGLGNAPQSSNLSPPRERGHRRRGSSLNERYPGDPTVNPLDMILKDTKRAQRSPHLRKQNHIGTDFVDRLDPTGMYHHESAYDAASLARNRQPKYSPIAALKSSTEEALKATPRENVINSVDRHHPLEGTAVVPPGMTDRFGRTYEYEEGDDLQRTHGADYKRYPNVRYLDGDLKGKGEPSYSIEKALKDHKHRGGDEGMELHSRSRNKTLGHDDRPRDMPTSGVDRSKSTGKNVGSQLKRRLLHRHA